jgi:hypothetical protein
MARHRWLKVKPHTRICVKCGCGRVSERDLRDEWQLRYHLPTGVSEVRLHTPPCEVGPKSAEYLAKYSREIADAAAAKNVARLAVPA